MRDTSIEMRRELRADVGYGYRDAKGLLKQIRDSSGGMRRDFKSGSADMNPE